MKDMLDYNPIRSITLAWMKCSSIALNELLAILLVNIAEEGLIRLDFHRFPQNCELDAMLLYKIA